MYEKVKDLCKQKNISINKLEEDLGFGRGAVSKWNISTPSFDKVTSVARYFNVNVDYFLEE